MGNATFGGGAGRTLTVEARELLIQNTAELIASFERESEEIEKRRKEAVVSQLFCSTTAFS